MSRKRADIPDGSLPTREALLAFIAEQGGEAKPRDIARAFGLVGGARIALKRMLRELGEEGAVAGRKRRLRLTGEVPTIFPARVTRITADGAALAEPDMDAEEGVELPEILILAERKSRSDGPARAPRPGDRVLLRRTDGGTVEGRIPARVIRVIGTEPERIIGVFHPVGAGGRIEPVDRKQKELTITPGATMDAEDGDLVAVRPSGNGRFGRMSAEVVEVFGGLGTERAISQIAILQFAIPDVFPAAVMDAAEAIVPVTVEGREDWRNIPLITIDPVDAKDHDDAVEARADDNPANPGGVIVRVAIADVAAYVLPGTLLDKEALKRGNSVYFPDRVVPMLPERLSNDLCSLREGEDRPALAVEMVFDANGTKLSHRFARILMRSHAKLAYEDAQNAIDGLPQASDKAQALRATVLEPLYAAYDVVKRGRDSRSPLELDLPERKLVLDDKGLVLDVRVPKRLEAHKLIEEFMIQANVAAAETLEKARIPLLYRVHDAPSMAKLESLREFLETIEINLPKQGNLRPQHFNAILKRVEGGDNAQLVSEVVLRSQAQAEYTPDNLGHFGLNLRRYAHFTSPIRRYADLVVHRGLIRALKAGIGALPDGMESKLAGIGEMISAYERRAMAAERDTITRLIARFLADRVGASFEGSITGVVGAGLFVRLDETGADGFIPASTLGADYFIFDEAHHRMIGRATGETFQLGDPVTVRLVEAAPVQGALRFEMLSRGTKNRAPSHLLHKHVRDKVRKSKRPDFRRR